MPIHTPTPRLALVTGGSRGLGRSTALALADRGFDVVLTFRREEGEAAAAVREIEARGRKAAAIRLDVGEVASFPTFVQELRATLTKTFQADRLHVLVNNAGVGGYALVAETSEAQFDELVNVHLKGVFFLTQRLLPILADGGRIVNVSTGLTRMTIPGYAAYSAVKSAIETFTRYLAKELGPRKITVNVVAPGAIETDFGGGHVRDDAAMNRMVASNTALGRVGVPDDVGPMIAALVGAENRWVNGQRIEVSGGQML